MTRPTPFATPPILNPLLAALTALLVAACAASPSDPPGDIGGGGAVRVNVGADDEEELAELVAELAQVPTEDGALARLTPARALELACKRICRRIAEDDGAAECRASSEDECVAGCQQVNAAFAPECRRIQIAQVFCESFGEFTCSEQGITCPSNVAFCGELTGLFACVEESGGPPSPCL